MIVPVAPPECRDAVLRIPALTPHALAGIVRRTAATLVDQLRDAGLMREIPGGAAAGSLAPGRPVPDCHRPAARIR